MTIADSKLSVEESRLLAEGQIEIIPATGIKIIKINSFEAAEYYQERVDNLYYGGGNTQWYFARTETDFNNSYQAAPIYIIFNGRVHFALYSCGRGYVFKLVNENDDLINIADPLFTLFTESFTKHLLSLNGEFIQWCTKPSIGLQLIAVKQDGESIQYIENPSPMIQWAAFKQNPYSAMEIPEDIRLPEITAAYKEFLWKKRNNLTESTNATETGLIQSGQIEIIPATGIKIIKINSFEAAKYYYGLVANKFGGTNIPIPWYFALDKHCFIDSNYRAPIYVIYFRLDYFTLYSRFEDPISFKLFNQHDDELSIGSGKTIFDAVPESFIKHLLNLNGNLIKYCEKPTIEQQLIAVQQNGMTIYYIENPLPMIQAAACRRNPLAINYIDPEIRDPSLVAKYKKKLEETVDSATTEATLIASGQVHIFFENAEIKILEVKSYRAVNFYISGSGSTLPFNSSNNFDQIKSYHPIYLIFDKKYRFIQDLQTIAFFKHENKYFDSRAYFRSIYDNSLHSNDISYWVKKFPPSFIKIVLAANGMYIDYVQNPSIAEQLISVQQNGFAIVFIDKPLPMIQAAACRQNPEAINYINPDLRDPTLVAKYGDHLNE